MNKIQEIKNNHITTILLNRPELHNAFDDELILELTTLLEKINQDPSIKVVHLAAQGKNFCAGADLKWMQKMVGYSHKENLRDAEALARLMQTLNDLNKPTIALVQGASFGGGVGLVACCDIAIATHDASFCFSEVKIGLVPAVISPYVIHAIGERSARRYFLTGEKFTAEEAHRLGLVHRLVEPDHLLRAGDEMTQLLLANSPQAVTSAKQLIRNIANQPLDQNTIRNTVECIASLRVSKEGQEGLSAFLEKRAPKWD